MYNDLVLDLANLIIQQGLATELDKDIFCDYIPGEVDELVGIYELPGTATAMWTHTSVRGVVLMVRSRKPSLAREKIYKIFDVLQTDTLILEIGKVKAIVNMRHAPIPLGTDTLGRFLFSFSMGITYNYK